MEDFVLPYYDSELSFETNKAHFDVNGSQFNMERHIKRHDVKEYSNNHPSARAGMIVGIFFHIVSLDMSLHVELGTVHIKMCLVGFKAQFGVIIRKYKIFHCQMPFVTAHTDELLVLEPAVHQCER